MPKPKISLDLSEKEMVRHALALHRGRHGLSVLGQHTRLLAVLDRTDDTLPFKTFQRFVAGTSKNDTMASLCMVAMRAEGFIAGLSRSEDEERARLAEVAAMRIPADVSGVETVEWSQWGESGYDFPEFD